MAFPGAPVALRPGDLGGVRRRHRCGRPDDESRCRHVYRSNGMRARHGARIATARTRFRSASSAISPLFVGPIVAAEDARFARHGAIDALAAARALAIVVRHGRSPSGASTIAMQLARIVAPRPSSAARQTRADRSTHNGSTAVRKRAILEAYFNRVPMGGNLYGVEAAARTYFGSRRAISTWHRRRCSPRFPTTRPGSLPTSTWYALRERQRYVSAVWSHCDAISQARRATRIRREAALRRHDARDRGGRARALLPVPADAAGAGRRAHDDRRALQRFVQAQARDVIARARPIT